MQNAFQGFMINKYENYVSFSCFVIMHHFVWVYYIQA